MWSESSSVKAVNLVKKSVTITEIMNFSYGIVFLLAHPVHVAYCRRVRMPTCCISSTEPAVAVNDNHASPPTPSTTLNSSSNTNSKVAVGDNCTSLRRPGATATAPDRPRNIAN